MATQRKPQDFYDLMASRILYQLERQGLIRMQGETVDEIQANIAKAKEIVAQIMHNGGPA